MREKLIKLLKESTANCDPGGNCLTCQYRTKADCMERITADYMISNGVTVQEWISVKDRLPQGADGKSLCEMVVAYLNNGEVVGQVCTGWLNGDKWYLIVGCDDYYTVWGLSAVTHWMPLPQPPKGE